jgi:hypothetical protein
VGGLFTDAEDFKSESEQARSGVFQGVPHDHKACDDININNNE